MLRLKFIVVDRTKALFLKEGETFYLDRLRKYANTQWTEVKPAKVTKNRSPEAVRNAEGESIAKCLVNRDYVIALDRSGKTHHSEGLALWMNSLSLTQSRLTFVIGGPLGLSKGILEMADEHLSLSRLTLTHEMSRLILLEQLYRAFTIINNESYHK